MTNRHVTVSSASNSQQIFKREAKVSNLHVRRSDSVFSVRMEPFIMDHAKNLCRFHISGLVTTSEPAILKRKRNWNWVIIIVSTFSTRNMRHAKNHENRSSIYCASLTLVIKCRLVLERRRKLQTSALVVWPTRKEFSSKLVKELCHNRGENR